MHAGCRCPACFGLAEYMLQLTGRDYGLPRAPGHAQPPAPEPAKPVQINRSPAAQPWVPRPPRKKAA